MHRPLAALLLTSMALPASAAESYDACAGFIDTLPATITTQGVWCLRKDLSTAIAYGAAIKIAANNVTIDCNGFKLGGLPAGPGSDATGIQTDRLNATVRGCAIRGFSTGVDFFGGGHLVEDNRFDQSWFSAIRVWGDNNLIQRNRVFDTGIDSMPIVAIQAQADIVDNTVEGVRGEPAIAIAADGRGTEVRGNRIRLLSGGASGSGAGIVASFGDTSVIDNRILGGTGEPVGGPGISATGEGQSFCRDNLVTNFYYGINDCEDNGGNVVHGAAPP